MTVSPVSPDHFRLPVCARYAEENDRCHSAGMRVFVMASDLEECQL
jgi:hypothetical protein